MPDPIIFISHHQVKAGKLEELREYTQAGMPLIEAGKPGTVVMLAYLNQDNSEISFFHLFPNAQAMDDHLQGADDRSQSAYEYLKPKSFEIYGKPSERALEMMRRQAKQLGMDLRVDPGYLSGFIRPQSG
ncbi:MAG: hypothetical protein JSV61_11430 [Anaerolineales bacterium]|nr:MAG: hypothetical protein JSV61_11430 [Anaerolineales bacterium]